MANREGCGKVDVDAMSRRATAVDAAIASRRSARRFLDTPVARETVETLIAVASRAPSGTDMQPWKVAAVAGDAKRALEEAILAARDSGEPGRESEASYYPAAFPEPYRSRRRPGGIRGDLRRHPARRAHPPVVAHTGP